VLEEVLQPGSLGAVERELVEAARVDKGDPGRFVGAADGATGLAGGEADVELLADLSVGVGDDVARVAVDADQARHLDVDACLFLDLAHHAGRQGLAELERAAGQRPRAGVRALDHQDVAGVVEDDRRRRHDQGVWGRRCGVVEVVDTAAMPSRYRRRLLPHSVERLAVGGDHRVVLVLAQVPYRGAEGVHTP
jgi:hypothetical protein